MSTQCCYICFSPVVELLYVDCLTIVSNRSIFKGLSICDIATRYTVGLQLSFLSVLSGSGFDQLGRHNFTAIKMSKHKLTSYLHLLVEPNALSYNNGKTEFESLIQFTINSRGVFMCVSCKPHESTQVCAHTTRASAQRNKGK